MCATPATDGRSTPSFGHEGTERPIHRPNDPEEPQEYDRGQKQCHTLKNLLVIHETGHMCFLRHTCEGKASANSTVVTRPLCSHGPNEGLPTFVMVILEDALMGPTPLRPRQDVAGRLGARPARIATTAAAARARSTGGEATPGLERR
jgi:hypothetical protein